MKDINAVGDKMTRKGHKMTISKSCIFFNRTDFIASLKNSRLEWMGKNLIAESCGIFFQNFGAFIQPAYLHRNLNFILIKDLNSGSIYLKVKKTQKQIMES